MALSRTQRINQMYGDVNLIAKVGRDGYLQYYSYIDEIVNNGEYAVFTDMMMKKYHIDITKYSTVDKVKKKTFDDVRFLTLSDDQQDLKDLYSANLIYQVGFYIYSSVDNTLLGQIREVNVYDELSNLTINLDVIRDGIHTTIDIDDTILEKYRAAVDLLIFPTATLSSTYSTIVSGTTASLNVDLGGLLPWAITYSYSSTYGTTYSAITGITASPKIIYVTPTVSTTYSIAAVSNATQAGTFSGTVSILVI